MYWINRGKRKGERGKNRAEVRGPRVEKNRFYSDLVPYGRRAVMAKPVMGAARYPPESLESRGRPSYLEISQPSRLRNFSL